MRGVLDRIGAPYLCVTLAVGPDDVLQQSYPLRRTAVKQKDLFNGLAEQLCNPDG